MIQLKPLWFVNLVFINLAIILDPAFGMHTTAYWLESWFNHYYTQVAFAWHPFAPLVSPSPWKQQDTSFSMGRNENEILYYSGVCPHHEIETG
jgi:hypothetical protein